MKIFWTNEFNKNLKLLPTKTRRLYKKQENIFFVNWKDPRLHTKKLKGVNQIFSFRITRKYRVLFKITDKSSILFVSIGHRKNIYD